MSLPTFKCIDGFLYKDGKLLLTQHSPLRNTLLEKFHDLLRATIRSTKEIKLPASYYHVERWKIVTLGIMVY